MKKNLLFHFAFLLFVCTTMRGQIALPNDEAQQKLKNVDSQFFIENKGQWPSEVLYLTQMGGLNTWITRNGMLYEFYKTEEIAKTSKSDNLIDKVEEKQFKRWGHRIGYNLIGNNQTVSSIGKQKQTGYKNYLLGNDTNKHSSNVGLYKEALVKNVYAGIDMRYYFDKGLLRYDYIVNPGADPSQIRFDIEGSEKTYLNTKNELVFTTCFGEVKNADLYCYQEQDKKAVNAKFIKKNEGWAIDLGTYNKNQTLIIDPLIYSTFIGGNNSDYAHSIALDASGNAYITGYTFSTNYDTTIGAFQLTFGGSRDIFITKLSSTGSTLLYSTYIGGSSLDEAFSIAVDNSNNAYITGYSGSTNYAITTGAFQASKSYASDIIVTKLNTTGTALIYSTYIGGDYNEEGKSIALDTSGNAYITGYSTSSNYPTSSSAFQSSSAGTGADVIVTKLNSTGTNLLYSTYIGGSYVDRGNSIAIDASGNAYITGETLSTNYKIKSGAFQTNFGGGTSDAFVTKLNSTGSALLYSTYIGGNNSDGATAIAINSAGNAYITGSTHSTNYDITSGVFQTTLSGGSDIFVTKINTTGSGLAYSTFIGGSDSDRGKSIKIDAAGNAYIAGITSSANYDVTSDAHQSILGGVNDVFVTKLNPTGTALVYSTYIGGSSSEDCKSIVLDTLNNVYITGETSSANYETTPGAYQTIYEGVYQDAFVTKLCMSAPALLTLTSATSTVNQSVSLGTPITNITYTTTGATGATFSGLPTGVTGNWASNTVTISGTPTVTGTFNYTINLNGSCGTTSTTGSITVQSLIANPDTASTTFGVASTPIVNVLANDTYNGAVATSSNTTLSFVSSTNSGVTLNTGTGAINVASTVPVGTYTLVYQICAVASPTICVNGTVTITVAPSLVANPDTATTTFGVASTPISNVIANDTLNGSGATSLNTILSFVSSTNSGITLNTSTGAVSVSATVPVGTYTLIYQICATVSPTTCVNGTVTITVNPSVINAVNDDFSTTQIDNVDGGPTPSVTTNDTINGVVVNNSDITITLINNGGLTGATISNTGVITVPAVTNAAIYTLTYQICQNSNPTNCDQATVIVKVYDFAMPTPNIEFGLRANNLVDLIDLQSDGKIIIGGPFTTYNNINAVHLTSLYTNVTLDETFPSTGTDSGTYEVYDMKIQEDDKIVLVGKFDGFNGGTNGRGIIRLYPNGDLDSEFNSGGSGVGTNDNIRACAIDEEGRILIGGGYMNTYNGEPVPNMIRLNVDGSIDPGFTFPFLNNYAAIFKIVVQPDGKILVAGMKRNVAGGQPNLFRLESNGAIDPTFTMGDTGASIHTTICTSCTGPIQNILLHDDKIIVVGAFNSYNGNTNYKNIVRLNSFGNIDIFFNGIGTSTDRVIKDVVYEPSSGKYIIAGEFTKFNSNSVNKIIRLKDNGIWDTSFSSGTGTAHTDISSFSYNSIHRLKRQNDGKIILGGLFTSYNGISALNITRIQPSIGGSQAKGFDLYESEPEIDLNIQSGTVRIYPNPSKNIFNIDLTTVSEQYNKVMVYNILGKIIYTSDLFTKSNNEINLSAFPSGYYMATIENTTNGNSKQVKLIKQ